MAELVSWRLLGGCPTAPGADTYGGLDLALTFADGVERAFGVRTPEVFLAQVDDWGDGYRPFLDDLDPASVGYWSFDRVLWLGPAPRPCVVWTNALGLRLEAVEHLLRHPRAGERLFCGHDGLGLPELTSVGRPARR